MVAIGNVWKARHVAVRTRLQPIRAMAGKEVAMNIRKQRKKANKRVWRYVVRRDKAQEPYGYVSKKDANDSMMWCYETRKARK